MSIFTPTIEQHRQADFDRQLEYGRQQRYIDEVTDASERISATMRNTFEYELGTDGHLWFKGKNIGDILDDTIKRNESIVQSQPQFMTELIRNYIEREEYDQQLSLALGYRDEDVLVVLSPIPDAVMNGADLGAYDRDRMKTMARVYRRTENGISATSLSLDRSDRKGLRAIVKKFGHDIADNATSEDILQMRLWGYSSSLGEEVVPALRRIYDGELKNQFGGTWFGGRQDSTVIDAMKFIEAQPDLIAEHLREIERVKSHRSSDDVISLLVLARYNFAAALSRRLRGEQDMASLSDAGIIAERNGETYAGDCPTAQTASQVMAEMAIGEREMRCPFCGLATTGDPCSSRLVCSKCSAEVNAGRLVSRGIGRKNALLLQTKTIADRERGRFDEKRLTRHELAKTLYGDDTNVRYQMSIGGAEYIVYDRRTGEDIAIL